MSICVKIFYVKSNFCLYFFIEIKKVQAVQGESVKLHCRNVTEGDFLKVSWLTNAHSTEKYLVYSFDNNNKDTKDNKDTNINTKFLNRIKPFHGTSIEIIRLQREDSGIWECNIFCDNQKNGKTKDSPGICVQTLYDVQIISK